MAMTARTPRVKTQSSVPRAVASLLFVVGIGMVLTIPLRSDTSAPVRTANVQAVAAREMGDNPSRVAEPSDTASKARVKDVQRTEDDRPTKDAADAPAVAVAVATPAPVNDSSVSNFSAPAPGASDAGTDDETSRNATASTSADEEDVGPGNSDKGHSQGRQDPPGREKDRSRGVDKSDD